MAQELKISYEEFVRGTWRAINRHEIEHTEFTPAVIHLLERIKPRLLKVALEQNDPRTPPYRLKEFLSFLQDNWNSYERPEKEFSN